MQQRSNAHTHQSGYIQRYATRQRFRDAREGVNFTPSALHLIAQREYMCVAVCISAGYSNLPQVGIHRSLLPLGYAPRFSFIAYTMVGEVHPNQRVLFRRQRLPMGVMVSSTGVVRNIQGQPTTDSSAYVSENAKIGHPRVRRDCAV